MRHTISEKELKDLCYEARIPGSDSCFISDSVASRFDKMEQDDFRLRLERRLTREVYKHPIN